MGPEPALSTIYDVIEVASWREQPTVLSGTSATGQGLHVAERATGLTVTSVSYTHLTLPTKA